MHVTLCILLIDNNAEDYTKMHRGQKRVSRKEVILKYTKVECSDKKSKGWDRRGIYRFNYIMNVVKKIENSVKAMIWRWRCN